MDFSTGRALLQASESSQDTAPFFGFIGAAAALVFSCKFQALVADILFAMALGAACAAPEACSWQTAVCMPHVQRCSREQQAAGAFLLARSSLAILPELLAAYALAGMGAAYGTAKSGVGIASMGVMRPELVMKSIVPVVMAGVLGIYGLIIAVIISTGGKYEEYVWRLASTAAAASHA